MIAIGLHVFMALQEVKNEKLLKDDAQRRTETNITSKYILYKV